MYSPAFRYLFTFKSVESPAFGISSKSAKRFDWLIFLWVICSFLKVCVHLLLDLVCFYMCVFTYFYVFCGFIPLCICSFMYVLTCFYGSGSLNELWDLFSSVDLWSVVFD